MYTKKLKGNDNAGVHGEEKCIEKHGTTKSFLHFSLYVLKN